jgi:hypothetical protein
MIDHFAPPPEHARTAAIALISCFLCLDAPTKDRAEQDFLGTGQERAAVAHACLHLCRALTLELRTPTAMGLIERLFLEAADANCPEDPDLPLAGALVGGYLQTPTTLPDDYTGETLHNLAAASFNDALDTAEKAGRGTQVFLRGLDMWTSLLPEASGHIGVAILSNVAAEIWPDP